MRATLIAILLAAGCRAAVAMENGVYEGPADGGWLTLTIKGNAAKVAVTGDRGCVGSGGGRLVRTSKNRAYITLRADGASCRVAVQKQGSDRYNLEENGCGFFHGAACGFDGFVRRR